MAWYDEAVFYHIYPLGLTGAPKENDYGEPVHRLNTLLPWIDHIREIGCNALYIGPLFESVGHGYETTDYRKVDSRLGTNEDLRNFVRVCHEKGVRVILDGVFNHTGRDFFAFQDIKKDRENSRYKDWYCGVNFWGNNSYNDGFSYQNWGGYDLLVKLNQGNPEVRGYICDTIRFWVKEFDIDGIRLDAADVLDFDYMHVLRETANSVKPDFWLMGEVIHGEYTRWVNPEHLHCVTNYHLHKALWSGCNEHNFFEIAHTVRRLYGMGGNEPLGLRLYNFVDNHDVERIYTKLRNKAHLIPVHVMLYTLPGVPSVYYGSEFGIEGKKERGSDASLRPELHLEDYADALQSNPLTRAVSILGHVRQVTPALSYGYYHELTLTTRNYAYCRDLDGERVIITVNNDDNPAWFDLDTAGGERYIGILSGKILDAEGGRLKLELAANDGEVWLPLTPEREALIRQLHEGSDIPAAAPIETAEASAPEAEETPAQEPEEAAEEKEETTEAPETEETAEETPVEEPEEEPAGETEEEAEAAPAAEAEEAPQPGTKAAFLEQLEAARKNTEPVKPEPSERDRELEAAFERGKIAGLQEAILAIMSKNGPVTDQMRQSVEDNVWHDSLINWVKSFH